METARINEALAGPIAVIQELAPKLEPHDLSQLKENLAEIEKAVAELRGLLVGLVGRPG